MTRAPSVLTSAKVALARRLGTGPAFTFVNRVREGWCYTRALFTNTYSQHGEDRFLLEYFGRDHRGFYIDVGASHPFIISNTYLLSRHGWHGITAEPIPYLWRRHKAIRPRDIALNVGVGDVPGRIAFHQIVPAVLSTFDASRVPALLAQGWELRQTIPIEVTTLKDLVRQHCDGVDVDLLSIDVEGWDLKVLEGNDWARCSPRLVVCEVSLETQRETDGFLATKGYRLLREMGCNRIYERAGSTGP